MFFYCCDLICPPEPKSHVIEVEALDWLSRENGRTNHTEKYEVVEERKAAVLRRGGSFSLGVVTKQRTFDLNRDRMNVVMEFGKWHACHYLLITEEKQS